MKNPESEEMYLETILRLKECKTEVRSIDIAEQLGYAKSSVSRAVNLLQKRGYIEFGGTGEIVLTESGSEKAGRVLERHRVITELLVLLGADAEVAEENACRIEHVVSAEIFGLIKEFVAKQQMRS